RVCICGCSNRADSSSNRAGCVCSGAKWPGSRRCFPNGRRRPNSFMAEEPSTSVPPPLPTSAQSSATAAPQSERGSRKTRVCEVISSGMNKTIVVRTVTRVPHPKFGKIVKQMKKFYAHDEENKAKTGDVVRIMETRPLSKLKRWRLLKVVQKSLRNDA